MDLKIIMLLIILMLFVCLNSVEAHKTRRTYSHKASLQKIQQLTDQLAECAGMFICGFDFYGAHCIPTSQVCDGHNHCNAGEDEANCRPKPPQCQHFEMLCQEENRCAIVCNGVPECMSQIDERNCDIKCNKGHVQCSDGKCAVVGDGKKECDDNSDENCPMCPVCDVGELFCINKITKKRECVSTCDDVISCVDEEDKTRLPTCPALCPAGWIRFQTSCYKIFADDLKLWTDAGKICKSFPGNSHRVIVESELENDFLTCELMKVTNYEENSKFPEIVIFWMDGTDMAQEGVFVWEHTSQQVEKTFFYRNQPDNGQRVGVSEQDCLVFLGLGNFLWSDVQCDRPAHYICEIEDP